MEAPVPTEMIGFNYIADGSNHDTNIADINSDSIETVRLSGSATIEDVKLLPKLFEKHYLPFDINDPSNIALVHRIPEEECRKSSKVAYTGMFCPAPVSWVCFVLCIPVGGWIQVYRDTYQTLSNYIYVILKKEKMVVRILDVPECKKEGIFLVNTPELFAQIYGPHMTYNPDEHGNNIIKKDWKQSAFVNVFSLLNIKNGGEIRLENGPAHAFYCIGPMYDKARVPLGSCFGNLNDSVILTNPKLKGASRLYGRWSNGFECCEQCWHKEQPEDFMEIHCATKDMEVIRNVVDSVISDN